MKKRYQIDQQRAVQQFRRLATEQNPNIQMILPMADIVGLLQEGVGNLLRHAGLELMHLVMDEEVKSLAGERHQQHEQRRAHRWGKEDGYCVVDGQKVPIKRTRLRSGDNREQRLGSYELFQRDGPLQQGVWDKMMRGLSTRNYGAVVKDFQSAYGIEKSAVSENFIEASREKVKQLMERPLGELRLCAVLIDGTPFKDRQMIAALGIGGDGRKTVLGIREGATENTAVPIGNGIDDDQTRRDGFAGRLDASERTPMDAAKFTANHHSVALPQQVLDDNFVTWEGRFDLGYVFGQGFIGNVAPNQLRRLRLAA